MGTLITVVAYTAGRTVPAGTSGLYLHMADMIGKSGFGLPATISGYGQTIPMAYPPLALYIVAILLKSGFNGLFISLWFPPLVTTAATFPAYLLGEEIENKRVGLLFSGFLFFTPTFIQLKFLANGLTHSLATLLTLTGLYFAARMYRTQSKRDTLIAGVLFGFVVMSHPRWTLICIAGYLALFFRDLSVRSLAYGAATAVIGLLVATPWLVTVIARHGVEPFLLASGTRGGLFNPRYFLTIVPTEPNGLAPFNIWTLTTIGGLYALVTKRWHLAAWPFLAAGLSGTFSGPYIALALLAAVLLDEVLLPAISDAESGLDWQVANVLLIGLLLLPGLIWSPLWMTNTLPGNQHPVETTLDQTDRDAMTYIESNFPRNVTIAVAQGPIDWFPYLSNRSTVISPFGAEWLGQSYQEQQVQVAGRLRECTTPQCVDSVLRSANVSAQYVYASRSKISTSEIKSSKKWTITYKNDKVVIFKENDVDRYIKIYNKKRVRS